MKIGKRKTPELDPAHAEFVVNVAVELDDAVRLHREALDALDGGGIDAELRTRLLVQARQASLVHRTGFWLAPKLAEGLPEPLWPFEGVRTLDRVAYGMVALAQEPPDAHGALSREDLHGLLADPDLADWMRFCLERAG